MGIEKELNFKLFHQREELIEHVSYEDEYRLYFAVASGDVPYIEKIAADYMQPGAAGNENNGILSRDPIQNTKYHFVIFTALITRLCVEYGMLREEAYTISDLYINKMDICTNTEDILHIQGQMLLDFTHRMSSQEKKEIYALPIMHAIDYINMHLQDSLTLTSISDAINLSPSYLSYLFKKETGLSTRQYILKKRINAAKTLLLYSDMTSSEIAEYFNFASQSYFISCFKKETGKTPSEYKKNSYKTS